MTGSGAPAARCSTESTSCWRCRRRERAVSTQAKKSPEPRRLWPPVEAAVLARVVDDDDGEVVGALQLAQVAEQGGHLAGLVLVDAMQAHEGIEQEQARGLAPHGLGEAVLVAREIEPHAGRGDDADGERGEIEAAVAAEAGESCLDDGRGVLGHVDQHAAGLGDGEGVEAGRAAGDGDGQIEPEPALAALGRAANDADAGAGPEVRDEPAAGGVGLVQVGGAHDGEPGVVVGAHPASACTDGAASIAVSMVWSSMKV